MLLNTRTQPSESVQPPLLLPLAPPHDFNCGRDGGSRTCVARPGRQCVVGLLGRAACVSQIPSSQTARHACPTPSSRSRLRRAASVVHTLVLRRSLFRSAGCYTLPPPPPTMCDPCAFLLSCMHASYRTGATPSPTNTPAPKHLACVPQRDWHRASGCKAASHPAGHVARLPPRSPPFTAC